MYLLCSSSSSSSSGVQRRFRFCIQCSPNIVSFPRQSDKQASSRKRLPPIADPFSMLFYCLSTTRQSQPKPTRNQRLGQTQTYNLNPNPSPKPNPTLDQTWAMPLACLCVNISGLIARRRRRRIAVFAVIIDRLIRICLSQSWKSSSRSAPPPMASVSISAFVLCPHDRLQSWRNTRVATYS